jgi:hypothetical protein
LERRQQLGRTSPVGGDALVFSGTGARCTNANDLAADTSFAGITFASGTRGYLLSGTASRWAAI